jgi:hypothetical protein
MFKKSTVLMCEAFQNLFFIFFIFRFTAFTYGYSSLL